MRRMTEDCNREEILIPILTINLKGDDSPSIFKNFIEGKELKLSAVIDYGTKLSRAFFRFFGTFSNSVEAVLGSNSLTNYYLGS